MALEYSCGIISNQALLDQLDPQNSINRAAVESYVTSYVMANPTFTPTSTSTIVIPVVFHVVYRTNDENVPNDKILSQLEQLNQDFSATNSDIGDTPPLFQPVGNMDIQFCLATQDPNGNSTTGILRKQTTKTSFSDDNSMKFDSYGGSSAWPADKYLNFWICNMCCGYLGYAQFPGQTPSTDGIVCTYQTIGSLSNPGIGYNDGTGIHYGAGRTATHEVGHWVGLRHIWGDGAGCNEDYASDTPLAPGPNRYCPTYPKYSTCVGNPIMMTMNYMDYTYDTCMFMFSPGQVVRARAIFAPGGTRNALTSSPGCLGPGLTLTPTIPPTATPPTTPGPTPTFTPPSPTSTPPSPTSTPPGGGGGPIPPINNTLLIVYTKCGIVNAFDNGIVNGRNSFEFTIPQPNGQDIVANIIWNDADLWWECIEKSTNTVISRLDINSTYPIGLVTEWVDVGTFTCLGSPNWFSTSFGTTPPVYFRICSDDSGRPESYFGVQNFPQQTSTLSTSGFRNVGTNISPSLVPIPGQGYYLEMRQFSGCAEVYGAAIPPTSIIYDASTYLFYAESFIDCESCTASTVTNVTQGCDPPDPDPTELYPSVQGTNQCGTIYLLGNECEPIVLYPMGVSCATTTSQSPAGNGTATLTITGGTSPYLTTWSNGQSGPTLTQLIPGEYTATTTDYYYDFTAITVCVVTGPQLSTSTFTVSTLPEQPKLCMSITVDGVSTQYQFNDDQRLINGKSTWVDNSGNYSIYWVNDSKLPYWYLQGFYGQTYKILNYSPTSPPTLGWSVIGSTFSNIQVNVTQGLCYTGDVCATFDNPSECGEDKFELTYNGEFNGQSSWTGQLPCGVGGNDWLLYFNTGTTKWETSGVTGSTGFLSEATNNPVSPFGNYTVSGSSYDLTISQGLCVFNPLLGMIISQNNPTQESNGSILCNVTGGTPPYQYSIDNGITFKNFPIFNGLKGGTYNVVSKDVSGATTNQTVILTSPQNVTVYNLYLTTTQSVISQTTTTLTKQYNTLVNITPSLPTGTTIVFDILHTNSFNTSPSQTASTLTTNSILKINTVPQSITTSGLSTSLGTNLAAGCQSNTKYITATTENWNSISIISGDTINVQTTTTILKNISNYCYSSNSNETYVLSNATISGCNYCQVVIT
jgi:hypothetical protein